MRLNQLPDDYDASKLGPQKRRTGFDSSKAKLSYDADNLILMAINPLGETGIKDASNEQVVEAIRIIVGSHRKDFTNAVEGIDKTLSETVKAKLYNENKLACLAEAHSREGIRAEYETFIDATKLPQTDALKLKEMMSEANYVIAVETAKELKASKIPTYEQIAIELMTYTPERLREICEIMEKPELVIESDQSFGDIVAAMDNNKHYTATDDQPQENTYVNRESNSPYLNLKKPGKVKVRIVDGVPHPKQLQRVSAQLDERRDHLTAKYSAKKMQHISPNGNAALLQQSMKRAKAAGDNSLIVDNWERWTQYDEPGTFTFIEPGELTESTLIACSNFDSDIHRANFYAHVPSNEFDYTRGRASMQVLEI